MLIYLVYSRMGPLLFEVEHVSDHQDCRVIPRHVRSTWSIAISIRDFPAMSLIYFDSPESLHLHHQHEFAFQITLATCS